MLLSAINCAGKTIIPRDVEWYWEGNVRSEFDTIDPKHNRLVSQTECPLLNVYDCNGGSSTLEVHARAEKEGS